MNTSSFLPAHFMGLILIFGVTACQKEKAKTGAVVVETFDISYPLIDTEPDKNPPFKLDATRPFHLEFARGGGRLQMSTTFAFDQNDMVVLHRQPPSGHWETSLLQLDAQAITAIARVIDAQQLTAMERAYHANVMHGTQWVFWLSQDRKTKSIYFNNHFPEGIQQFADVLDRELQRCGVDNATWTRVSRAEEMEHQQAIWNRLKE